MKQITITATAVILILGNNICRAQQSMPEKKEPLPEYIYLYSDMKKAQVDSMITALMKYDIDLSFDTLQFDNTKSIITKVSGTMHQKGQSRIAFKSDDFKGLTLVTRKVQFGRTMLQMFAPERKK